MTTFFLCFTWPLSIMERSIKVSICIFSNELRGIMIMTLFYNPLTLPWSKEILFSWTALCDTLACFSSSCSVLSLFILVWKAYLDWEDNLTKHLICFQILLRLAKGLPESCLHVKPLRLAGQLWAFLTKFSGHCIFSLLLLFWRSKY